MEKEVIEVNEEITEAIAPDSGENETAIADETTANESTEQPTATTDRPASKCDGTLTQDDADSEEPVASGVTEAEVERLIAEAEARGYERGRNENIEAWMNEGRAGRQNASHEVAENEVMILNNMRRSVWE